MAGSEFMEMLVELAHPASVTFLPPPKKSATGNYLIDEIDAIGRQRGVGLMGGHDEREQTLNSNSRRNGWIRTNRTISIIAAN